jgi:hypothetical protein
MNDHEVFTCKHCGSLDTAAYLKDRGGWWSVRIRPSAERCRI